MRTTPKPGSLIGLTQAHLDLLNTVSGGAVFQLAALTAFPSARLLVDSLRARGLIREVRRLSMRGAPLQFVITDCGRLVAETCQPAAAA